MIIGRNAIFPGDSSPLVFKVPLLFSKPLSFINGSSLLGLLSLPLCPFVLHSTWLPLPFTELSRDWVNLYVSPEYLPVCVYHAEHV